MLPDFVEDEEAAVGALIGVDAKGAHLATEFRNNVPRPPHIFGTHNIPCIRHAYKNTYNIIWLCKSR